MSTERDDLLATLATQRHFLRHTVRDLTDEQAALRPTRSELCLGGLIKHVAQTEDDWLHFAVGGAEAMTIDPETWLGKFQMTANDTLAAILDQYAQVAERTSELVGTLDLDTSYELPRRPWFEPGARWSVRRVLLHVLRETAQHAGHADILRESIDGAKTMG
ncbi:MAG TPA: DinB family protein [Pseudonocardiaceae bacterium]|nr:DinB family protein [Pseudonocardiaceae bacterium]